MLISHRSASRLGARSLSLLTLTLVLAGCSAMGAREKGGAIGAAGGAVVGGVIGNQTGSTARGAIIGAVVGGAAGAIIGHQMDQQAKELQMQIPGATVERVGEGIQVTFSSGLLFGFDSDQIQTAAGANLQNLAESLKKYPNTSLLIVGHTDALGSSAYNQDLSTRRATSASRYLSSYGIAGTRLRIAGRGELEPMQTNETEAGRASNRRIEVAIFVAESSQ